MASSSTASKPSVGILSIGDMGMGIGRLLRHHDYAVYTVATGRRQAPPLSYSHTLDRIKVAQITALASDEELVAEVDILLSIVPPRDAVATARRALEACHSAPAIKRRGESKGTAAPSLIYIDLNAISPRTARSIASLFTSPTTTSTASPSSPTSQLSIARSFSFHRTESEVEPQQPPISINFLDGGIIGGPPSLREDKSWKRPSIVISGPEIAELLDASLRELLNVKIVGDAIGPASALKSCFAALSKGTIALSILSFTTAHSCGVLPALKEHLAEFYPAILAFARAGLTSMPPKAYRWVDEMRQINETFSLEGVFSPDVLGDDGGNHHHHDGASQSASQVFEGVAEIYKLIADDTVLGEERTEKRKRGTNVEDVVECVREGIARKKKKGEGEGNLDATWRGSWA
ncbi:hypothetical protein A1O1_04425 [Capronia coronata CBS 617.96]|uniref:Phosphogluconate dehydrogenase NAD-binding putative C-terminal domain-containing protein n=1 Tax=Capronia coronata CBS 617.96 TaxID=1182541 RepID=W9Z9X1_9EURO|nr:uncharacterized protein A1O1_04425 [Capronia coronata CBS 617.96]EXJ91314.1 hypothetical protein A1O1_04425 [Capronia coronata CBS 617.96]